MRRAAFREPFTPVQRANLPVPPAAATRRGGVPTYHVPRAGRTEIGGLIARSAMS